MKRIRVSVIADDRGLAGIEFALTAPVLLLLVGCVVDFSLAFQARGQLASSVAQGVQYAFLAGSNVAATSIQNIVQQALSLPEGSVTVIGPSCYCISGTLAAITASGCAQPCPDGTTTGTYMTISAHYTYQSIMPAYSYLVNPVLVESATVRLK